jgi:hypothetical protein
MPCLTGALTHLGVICTVEAEVKALPSCKRMQLITIDEYALSVRVSWDAWQTGSRGVVSLISPCRGFRSLEDAMLATMLHCRTDENATPFACASCNVDACPSVWQLHAAFVMVH